MPDRTPLPSTERLLSLIDGMAGREVVMLVDLVADRFITGTPKRVSREAPVLILQFEEERLVPGGGANAVANVAALGGVPLPLGILGDDASGEGLLQLLEELDVDRSGIARRRGYRTPTKTRILGGGPHAIKQQIVRYDVEEGLTPNGEEESRFQKALESWNGRAGVAVLSDYGYGTVLPTLVPRLRQGLREPGLLLCDSRHRLEDYQGVDAATPNEEEVERLLGGPLDTIPGTFSQEGHRLREQLGLEVLLLTRGSSGMSLFIAERSAHLPVHGTDQVADVTGAGDTVIGTFALALAAGAGALEAAVLANYAGGVVVLKMGTATLSAEELREAVSSDSRPLKELRWERS